MPTSTHVNFYRGSYTDERLLQLCQTAGNIVFDNSTNRIYAGTVGEGANIKPKVYGSQIEDASFSNSVLTITKLGDSQPSITLDFSDVASASSMMDVFSQLEFVIGSLNNTKTAPNYSSDTTGILTVQSVQNLTSADQALANAIVANNKISNYTSPVYQTTGDNTFDTAIQNNRVQNNDALQTAINKLDNKSKVIIDAIIDNEEVTEEAFAAIKDSVGLDSNFQYSSEVTMLQNVDNVHDAIDALAEAIGTGAIHGVQINGNSIVDSSGIANVVADGTYNSSTNKIATQSTITNAINALDSTATIASKSGNVVTIKAGLVETNGIVTNNTSANIVLEEVASTGAAADVSISDSGNHTSQTTVEGAIGEIYTKIEALEGSFDVIISSNAANTPAGVEWGSGASAVTGSLAASATTFHKLYLVPGVGGTSTNSYAEYITTKTTSGSTTTYAWERLGDIDIDLTGYAKTITVNGKQYAVDSNSTNVTLTDLITAITGETAISGGNSNYVAVTATTTKNTSTGANSTVLASSVKIEEVADGLTKDTTPSYTSGHFVIENGKLVSASGKSGVDTYTKSSSDGLVTASDAKAYVDSQIQSAKLTWSEWA